MSSLDSLYKNMHKEIHKGDEEEKGLSDSVEAILGELKGSLSQEDYDKVDDVVFQAANLAEQEGFKLGMRFLMKVLLDCVG